MSSLKELSSVHSLPTLVQLCSLEGTKLVFLVYVNISSLFSMGLVRAAYKTRPFPFCCAHCPTAQNSGPFQPRVGNAERPLECITHKSLSSVFSATEVGEVMFN